MVPSPASRPNSASALARSETQKPRSRSRPSARLYTQACTVSDLPALPGLLHDGRAAHAPRLDHHVELAQPVATSGLVRQLHQLITVEVRHVAHGLQPVVDEPELALFPRSLHATAAIVAAHDDVLDPQHVDGVLQHRQAAEVVVQHEIGDVAVHEQLARREADDLVGRHAAVGATDPQEPRRLLRREFAEEAGLARLHAGGPAAVVDEQLRQLVHECGGPAGIRTQDQGIHVTPGFPPGVDYLFTPGREAGRVRDALRLSSRALQPSGSLCTFRRCTAGLAQGCHPQCRKVSLNSSRPLRGLRRGGTSVMSPLH